jgi:hypothetical protein
MEQQHPQWETRPYLERIWHADELHWQERAMLMEMHKAGALNEGDLHLATLRSLSSSGLHAEGMRAVLQRFWDRFAYAEGRAACSAEVKNSAPQELLREQVTPPRRAAWRSSWCPGQARCAAQQHVGGAVLSGGPSALVPIP